MKILVLGNGFIGNKIQKHFNCDISTSRILDHHDVNREIAKYHPDIVINAIGVTGRPNIDWCEDNKQATFFGNIVIPSVIEKSCIENNKKMIHIGSGCIYNNGTFSESDKPNFYGSTYSRSKILAEQLLGKDVLQLRIRMPISSVPEGRNLITKILKYENLIDVKNSVTVVDDFLIVMAELISKNAKGIFNVVNPVPVCHSEIINIYNKYSINKKKYAIISLDELSKYTISPRSNCVLSTDKLESLGIRLRNAPEAIEECIKSYTAQESLCVA